MEQRILTLTTDFGLTGSYVAALKGVLLELAPGTQLVDVCHTIAPQNILEGGFILAGVVDVFPKGTVHLVVVDPGVGTERRLIAAMFAEQWFVLPDNGLITGVARRRTPGGIWELTNPGCSVRSSRRRSTGVTSWRPRPPICFAGEIRRCSVQAEINSSSSGISSRRLTSAGIRRRGDFSRHVRQPDNKYQRGVPG